MSEPAAVWYLAAPLSGDVAANLARAERWLRYLVWAFPDWAYVMSWAPYVRALPDERRWRDRGLRDDIAVVKRCDGIILVGGRISEGMTRELGAAMEHHLLVMDMTKMGPEPPPIPGDQANAEVVDDVR